jgi:glycosyltransferase involved in cell wall biosynthesis
MRCLWITLANPDPAHNGQYVYSGGLIRSLAGAGADVVVLGLDRPESAGLRNAGVEWQLVSHKPRPQWSSVASPLPNIANRCCTPDMQTSLALLLAQREWEVIVFDGISAGWALAPVVDWQRRTGKRPRLVYISHNHEESLRRALAKEQSHPLKRVALHLDSLKVTRLERALVREADIITAITEEDGSLYQGKWPERPIHVLTPGFAGTVARSRRITSALPRRAILVGSFDWIAKRMNLEEFVRVADPIFAANGVELHVIGSAEPSFLDSMRRRVVTTRFLGKVGSVQEHMADARIALVPERTGGGFKLKVLDYIFARMPIFALKGSVAGVPLRDGDSISLYADQEALAMGVVQAIDEIDRLNHLQEAAYRACADQFDWSTRGQQLIEAIAA